ncbi:MAG TPA: ABC transporter permease [Anaerolineales bacterium]|nr:ABC transporter permease [Anaerolineales bacterium]
MRTSLQAEQIQTIEPVEFTYDSQKRKSPALEELQDIIQYRDLIFQLVRRDIVARYKRSVLGIVWTMLQPLGMMIVLTAVFSQLFGRVEGYAAYLLSGLLAWTFFAQTTTAAIEQSVWGGALMRRIYIPHTAFSVASVGTGVVNLLISLIPLFAILLIVGRPITWAVLFIPIPIILLTAFALGVGLILSTLGVRFPDVLEMYRILIQAWMYLTPIMYPSDILPDAYRSLLLYFNPMYYLILMFRVPIYDGVLPSLPLSLIGTGIALVTLVIGWIYFSHQADKFAYAA